MKARGWFSLLAAVGLFALVGCQPPQKATLEIVLSAPEGITPKVRVTGPDNSSQFISTTTTLKELIPGSYTLTPQDVETTSYTYGAAESTVSLQSGETKSASITYAAKTGLLKVNVTVENNASPLRLEVRKDGIAIQTITAAGSSSTSLAPGSYQIVATQRPTNYAAVIDAPGGNITVEAGKEAVVNANFASGFGSVSLSLNTPEGVAPKVTLTGPGSYSKTFDQLSDRGVTTINDLAVGTYTITANVLLSGGIDYAGTVNPSSRTLTVIKADTVSGTVTYAPTSSVVVANVSGLSSATDPVTVSISPQPSGITPITRSGNGTVRFERLPFNTYTLSAATTGVQRGTYIDQQISATPVATTTNAANASVTPTIAFSATQTARIYLAGNGSLNNTGITTQNGSVSGTSSGEDKAVTFTDANLPTTAGATFNVENLSPSPNVTPQAGITGLARLEFDPQGNIFAVYHFQPGGGNNNRIVRYPNGDLSSGAYRVLTGAATADRVYPVPVAGGGTTNAFFSTVRDIAFDSTGNLWVANEASGTISCVSATQLNTGTGEITRANLLYDNFGSADTDDGNRTSAPRALAFDRSGNLWVAGGRYAFQLGQTTYLVRIPNTGNNLVCPTSLAPQTTTGPVAIPNAPIDIRLATDLLGVDGGPFSQPSALALSPDGNSLWVADYGAGTDYYSTLAGCVANGSMDINTTLESVIKVPLTGTNIQAGSRNVTVSKRITVGPYDRSAASSVATAPARGMQQASALAFDSRGNLWVGSNNNIEIDPANVCYPAATAGSGFTEGTAAQRTTYCGTPATAPFACPGPLSRLLTNRRGKLYVVGSSDLADNIGSPTSPVAVTPLLTINGPAPALAGGGGAAAGFTSIAFRLPITP